MELKAGYKQTEVGVIPEEWEVKPLSEVSYKITVGIASAATHAYRDKGVPMFRNQNIKAGYLDDSDLLFIAPEYEATFKSKRLRGGDLLTMRTGYPGVTAVVPQQYESAQSFTTLIIRPKTHEAESDYLCHFINSERGQQFFSQSQIGGAQKNVNAGTLRNMPVPLPRPTEQRAIAAALSDVDGLLGGFDRLIAKKRELKQAAAQQLLTGRTRLFGFDSMHGMRLGYKQTEVGVIPEDWEVWPVRQKGEVVTGKALAVYGPGKQRPYLRTKNVFDGRIDIEDVLTMPMTDDQFENFRLRHGDILLNEGQSLELVGRCAMYQDEYPEPCAIQNQLLRFRAREGVSGVFASYLFRYCQQTGVFARIALQTTSIAHLGGSRFEQLLLAWPKSELEQRAIADALSDMDAEISALERRREKTRALKQAVMQELLTGRTRLV